MELVPVVNSDDKNRRAAGGFTANTLTKTASYTVTAQDINFAGGHLFLKATVAAANDVTLPAAYTVPGARVTLLKGQASTNALSALANAVDQIDAGTAGKRYQNVTAEFGTLQLWADPASTSSAGVWRIVGFRGTWVANNS